MTEPATGGVANDAECPPAVWAALPPWAGGGAPVSPRDPRTSGEPKPGERSGEHRQPAERGSFPPVTAWPISVPDSSPRVPPGHEPTFSIVIAAYQAESTVAEAVSSALRQTYPALEVIVCDDGSTDGTAGVLNSFGGAITVIRQDNRGEAAAKNLAVRHARGDYVVVLDADDVFLPRRLEALAWLAMRHPDLDILATDAVVEADGEPIRTGLPSGVALPGNGPASRHLGPELRPGHVRGSADAVG